MKPLRILSVANVPKDRNAGAAGAELETILALRELGHEVDDIWSDTIGRRISHGNLHQLIELPRRYAQVVRGRLHEKSYDVVHVNQPHGFAAARYVRERAPATVFIHRSHGFEPRVEEVLAPWRKVYGIDGRGGWRRIASSVLGALLARHNRQIVRWADGHILCSQQDADFMIQRFGAEPARVAVLPQAAPDSFRGPLAPMTPERLRTILYVGQYAFVKAPMVVAQAMNLIARERPDARFIWIAGGNNHEHIRALLDADVLSRLELVPWIDQAELPAHFDRAGIFLFPSFFEGSGKAHLEALSRGLCVVTTRVGGMRDTISDGVTGALVNPGDAAAVASRALALMDDLAAASAMSRAAGARARELSWHRTAIETAAFYRRVLDLKKMGHAG
jgi:glycosyltransferase involved in cell wall biosynthesis